MWQDFFYFFTIFILSLISPGPDFVIVLRQSLSKNAIAGIMCALGISLGVIFHISYTLFGFAIIIANLPLLFTIIKYLGAGYLIYLGISSFIAKKANIKKVLQEQSYQDISLGQSFKIGLITNLLNPKAIIFIMSLTTIIAKDTTYFYIKILYIICIFIITFTWFSFVAIFFSNKYIKEFFNEYNTYINKLLGLCLIFFAFKLITM